MMQFVNILHMNKNLTITDNEGKFYQSMINK